MIPDAILNIERTLTASEISVYNIYAGPGGIFIEEWYSSKMTNLKSYRFYLRSTTMDKDGLYYLTIRKEQDISDDPQVA